MIFGAFFLIAAYFIVNSLKVRFLGFNNPLQRYLIPALTLKMAGAICSGLVYQFYYGGGDTMDFYTSASYVSSLCFTNFSDFIGLLNSDPILSDPNLEKYSYLDFIADPPTWTVVRLAAIIDIFSFDSYIVIALFFSLFSLYASWQFFSLITRLYPDVKLRQKFAYCIFYIPSVVFWGSGVFKDTLTLCGLYLFTVHIYAIVIKRQFSPRHFIWLIIGLDLMISIRIFYLVILLPCLALWFFAEYRDKLIKNRLLKTVSFPLLILFSVYFIGFGLTRVMSTNDQLSRTALTTKAQEFQDWHGSLGGSAYTLGITDYSTTGLIKAIPLGINVSLFRPYLWEAHSVFQYITALQSLFFLLFTIRTVIRTGFSVFLILTIEPIMLFTLSFSLLYSFVAGFTSYNFGALDRYKIPALPLYMITLVLVNYHKEKNTLAARNRRQNQT
jgi:hypothetical protein